MRTKAILISGSNRGIGLELVRQYAQSGWRVFATCRHPAEALELHRLAGHYPDLSIHRLDITNPEDIKAITWELENTPIDVLFNNAGIFLETHWQAPEPGALRYDDWLRTFEVNTLGPVRLTEALVDNIAQSEKRLVVAMSSTMGSISHIEMPGSYYYRSSKAALNAAMTGLSATLKTRGIGVLLLHPGGVRTRMGPSDGISPKESVDGIRKIIDEFTLERSGSFLQYDGTPLSW